MYPGGSWSQSSQDEPVVFKKIQVCVHVTHTCIEPGSTSTLGPGVAPGLESGRAQRITCTSEGHSCQHWTILASK